jgi:hypothetical protein
MDDIVKQAMAKWPNVPHCYGWLGLDGRGDWYLRDDAAQAAGDFSSANPMARGSRLQHEKLIEFIQRNYAPDQNGCWYFQNGPQRVYVELMHTPWIWRIRPDGGVESHTGIPTEVLGSYLDEVGLLYLRTSLGLGLVHTADMDLAAAKAEQGEWAPEETNSTDLSERYCFIRSPSKKCQPNQPR